MNKLALIVLLFTANWSFTQTSTTIHYFDIPANHPGNPQPKPGWNLIEFDEFNGGKEGYWMNQRAWDPYDMTSEPFFFKESNQMPSSTYFRLISSEDPSTDRGITKPYTSAILNSDNGESNDNTNPHKYLYGYFEARIRNPIAQLTWPAFWLYGSPRVGVDEYNEIDVFEFATGQGANMTNHWYDNGKQANSYWVYAMPGQTFGESWVTYAVKWEPNKIVWYINNKVAKVITDEDAIIPSWYMRVKINTAVSEIYARYDQYLEENFPNYMDIDYVRMYQRSDHQLADPVFTVEEQNGKTFADRISIPFDIHQPVYVNAIESYMPTHDYYFNVQECDNNGNLIGNEAKGWLTAAEIDEIDHFNIRAFAAAKGLTFAQGKKYRIKLASGSPWQETHQYIELTSCQRQPIFNINGFSHTTYPQAITTDYNDAKSRVVMDASASTSCNDSWYISVQECNSSGNGIGLVKGRYLLPSEKIRLDGIDIDQFAVEEGIPLEWGKYYRVTLAVGVGFNRDEKVQIIHLPTCNTNVKLTLNDQTPIYPQAVSIGNGDRIIADGAGSKFCTDDYYLSLQECDANGNPFGTKLSKWSPINIFAANKNGFYYDIGEIDIRDWAKQNSFDLKCSSYYKIKIAGGSPWNEKAHIFYMEPCSNVDNSFLINTNSATTISFPSLAAQKVRISAPDAVSCDEQYYLNIQKIVNGVLTGPEAKGWLTKDQVYELRVTSSLNLVQFASNPDGKSSTNDGITLENNAEYQVKFVPGSGPSSCSSQTWAAAYKIIQFGTPAPLKVKSFDSNKIEVFPNPTNGKFTIQLDSPIDKGTLRILDVSGKVVLEQNFSGTQQNIEGLASGTYLIQLRTEGEILNRKVYITK